MKKIIIRKDTMSTITPKAPGMNGVPCCPLCGAAMERTKSAGCIRYITVLILTACGIVGLFFGIIPGIIILIIAGAICPRKILRCTSCGGTHQRK